MKKYKQFLQENYKEVGSGEESNVRELSKENPLLVIKKSKNGQYIDLMNEVHEMMSKRNDLFCRIKKHNNDYVITEKLNCESFNKVFDFQNNLIKPTNKLNYLLNSNLSNYSSGFEKKSVLEWELKNYIFNDVYKDSKFYYKTEFADFEFIINFILLKYEIYNYFENFIEDSLIHIKLDLHNGNFGFIKGTQEIRCFDPIYIE